MSSTTDAASGFRKVRVFNHKPASCWRLDKIDFRAVKMRIEFPLRSEHDTVEIIFRIDCGIKHRIEAKGIIHSTASATKDTDPQKCIAVKALHFLDPSYFVYRRRSD